MSVINNITLKEIMTSHPELAKVIRSSIGLPTQEKIHQVLESYKHSHHYLMGAFCHTQLIAVIGFQLLDDKKICLRHISVLPNLRKQKIGTLLIYALLRQYPDFSIHTETDEEAVGFYQKIGFICETYPSPHGVRYTCRFIPESSF